jgi:DNA/RNA endonuclease G (NUC1)
MRTKIASSWVLFVGALMSSSLATAQVRISEIHYDNTGTDSGEAIEVSAPAGTDLTGWQIVLYNGNGGTSYDTDALSGVVSASCGARGVVVLNYPSNGIQNGAPDGLALVDASGAVVEFLSYEGVFAATNGPASGLTSSDIVAFQDGAGPVGESLARDAAGTWTLATSTFGVCNDDGETPPDAEVASIVVSPDSGTINVGVNLQLSATARDANGNVIPGAWLMWSSANSNVADVGPTGIVTGISAGYTLITAVADNGVMASAIITVNEPPPPVDSDFHINEIHYDNAGTDTGEAIEIEGPAGADLTGFSVVLYNGNGGATYDTRALSGTLPASCADRGVVTLSFPTDGLQNGAPDGIALVDGTGVVLEFVSYEGVVTATAGPAGGMMSIDIGISQTNADLGTSLQRNSAGAWASGVSNFGACNPEAPVPPANTLTFSGRNASDPALPVGFEDQLFATLRGPGNVAIPTTITWTSETPAVAGIDANGVLRALAAGTATVRATAADGTTATYSLPTRVAVASTTAQYANNTEFGEPQDADPADDFLVERPQFTSSWNPNRGSPNWVAYEFDASHFGTEDRCDCFTMDESLPATLPRLTTADYTGAGDFHGYAIDRGHLARSFDRTAGSLDNATTFYFSNIIPQAADQNQGPWAQLENDLGNFARNEDREVYVLAGATGNKGTLKNEGKVVIPTHTWKVAVIMPRDRGLADVRDYRDVQVIAVVMPNEPGVRNVPWQTYASTVDAVEALSGYDLLALLEDDAEAAVESNTQPPIATVSGPAGAVNEGDSVSLSAGGSVDPNGTIVSYAWEFGDGDTASGISVAHTFAQDGTYTVRLTATDNDGLVDVATFTVTVNNVAPAVGTVADGSLNLGATYTVSGTFTDPGADNWTATVIWGDGSAPEVVPLSGRSFTLTHIYTAGGSYPVSISIADDDTATATNHTVMVNQPSEGLAAALPLIDQLVASGKISRSIGTLLKAQVIAAQIMIGRDNEGGAILVLRSMVVQLDLLIRCRKVAAADVAPLRSLLLRTIDELRAELRTEFQAMSVKRR